jgi:hypothetical protein
VTKKSKRKKKPKKLASMKSSVSIKSKAAWAESGVSRKSPAGSNEKDRVIPDGAEKEEMGDFGQDNRGFEAQAQSLKKDPTKKNKKEQKATRSVDNSDVE